MEESGGGRVDGVDWGSLPVKAAEQKEETESILVCLARVSSDFHKTLPANRMCRVLSNAATHLVMT